MREIKFKAWHKKWKVMSEGYSLWNIDHIHDDFEKRAQRKDSYGEDDVVYLQYTGLKDVNGNEIYEGDIVKHFGVYVIKVGEVVFENGSFKLKYNKNRHIEGYSWTLTGKEKMGIIGNVYKNPKLKE